MYSCAFARIIYVFKLSIYVFFPWFEKDFFGVWVSISVWYTWLSLRTSISIYTWGLGTQVANGQWTGLLGKIHKK